MSAGHVFARPTVFIVILVFTLLLGSTSDDAHYNLYRCTVVRRFSSLSKQGKLPIFPGGYLKKFYTGRLRPEVQPLTLLYTIFFKIGTPFVYLLLEKGTPFIYLLKKTVFLFLNAWNELYSD